MIFKGMNVNYILYLLYLLLYVTILKTRYQRIQLWGFFDVCFFFPLLPAWNNGKSE